MADKTITSSPSPPSVPTSPVTFSYPPKKSAKDSSDYESIYHYLVMPPKNDSSTNSTETYRETGGDDDNTGGSGDGVDTNVTTNADTAVDVTTTAQEPADNTNDASSETNSSPRRTQKIMDMLSLQNATCAICSRGIFDQTIYPEMYKTTPKKKTAVREPLDTSNAPVLFYPKCNHWEHQTCADTWKTSQMRKICRACKGDIRGNKRYVVGSESFDPTLYVDTISEDAYNTDGPSNNTRRVINAGLTCCTSESYNDEEESTEKLRADISSRGLVPDIPADLALDIYQQYVSRDSGTWKGDANRIPKPRWFFITQPPICGTDHTTETEFAHQAQHLDLLKETFFDSGEIAMETLLPSDVPKHIAVLQQRLATLRKHNREQTYDMESLYPYFMDNFYYAQNSKPVSLHDNSSSDSDNSGDGSTDSDDADRPSSRRDKSPIGQEHSATNNWRTVKKKRRGTKKMRSLATVDSLPQIESLTQATTCGHDIFSLLRGGCCT
ncbi:hypothetical protein KDA14_03915, partial [Candidatus Saccharibacteria bacterium]|nr:hypothetical protein [Candidatus Saccharibacteria bacterium]